MADTASLSSELAGRYATALYELSEEAGLLFIIEGDLQALKQALADSADLRDLISSPIYTREQQSAGIEAVAAAMELQDLTRQLLGVMAGKRRLFALPGVVNGYEELMMAFRGEVAADVKSAAPLTEAQLASLSEKLSAAIGKTVKLNVSVDEALIGGLVVKVGSKMIDTSIATKLAKLNNAMKEVG